MRRLSSLLLLELQPAQPTVTEVPAPEPMPVAEATPEKEEPIEIAQVETTPAPAPVEQPAELPKTGTDLPLIAIGGILLLLAGAVLRRKTA